MYFLDTALKQVSMLRPVASNSRIVSEMKRLVLENQEVRVEYQGLVRCRGSSRPSSWIFEICWRVTRRASVEARDLVDPLAGVDLVGGDLHLALEVDENLAIGDALRGGDALHDDFLLGAGFRGHGKGAAGQNPELRSITPPAGDSVNAIYRVEKHARGLPCPRQAILVSSDEGGKAPQALRVNCYCLSGGTRVSTLS